jgi:glycine dehydrogenase
MHAEHLSHALTELENRDEFIGRHIGPGEHAIAAMLASIGTDSLRTLIGETVPATIRLQRPLDLPAALPEHAALAALKSVAAKNVLKKSLIGQGYYGTLTPPVILRNLFENPGWYTAYTPYQAEIAQGRLEALLNYQQMVVDLTGLEIANASLLDEATAAAEAMTMARRISKSKGNVFFVDEAAFPQTIDVIRTRAGFFDFDLVYGKPEEAHRHDLFGALFQYPNARGEIADLTTAIAEVKNKGGVVAVASDLMALVLLKSPGEMGADIALGSSQRFGVPMGFGGPHAAFFATREAHVRSMPGRHHRRLQGRARQGRLPHGAADARTAHPPREGQFQHLHLAGAAGQHRRHVRGVARAERPARHRLAHPPPRRPAGRRAGRHGGATSSTASN